MYFITLTIKDWIHSSAGEYLLNKPGFLHIEKYGNNLSVEGKEHLRQQEYLWFHHFRTYWTASDLIKQF